MKEIILAKYGEIALKGLNKNTFENLLIKNMRRPLAPLGSFSSDRQQSTIYVESEDENTDYDSVLEKLKTVFGIAVLCRAAVFEKEFEKICEGTYEYLADTLEYARTFKVEAKRADKRFPMKSPEICCELGGRILEKFPHLKVDVKNPEVTVTVEIRDTNAYVHAVKIHGAGGLPVARLRHSHL